MTCLPRRERASILSDDLVWHIALVALLFLGAEFGVFAYAIDGAIRLNWLGQWR